ncbi:MAG: FkbM family methyltransferase [Bacilli bacterium]|nr:FkbM family methyltransferase [Bacilli bacterium]
MNIIDKNFKNLVDEIKSISEKELYYKIRMKFDQIPLETKNSCMNFFNQFGYWGYLDIDNNNYQEIELKAEELHRHIDDFLWFYNHLEDYRSKALFYAILNNWYKYDFLETTKTKEYLYDDYFDLDLVKCDKNEVIVDLGAYVGDSILSYLKNYGDDCYKKIFCYEITPENFDILKNNLAAYPNIEFKLKGISNKTGNMKINNNSTSSSANSLISDNGDIEVTTLDEDIKDKITLIKSDIEGFEQKAIEGAKNHIINDHPKLLISVYHSNEDLWKIPKMIHELSSDYKFYLRFNSSPIYPTEITLIAI